MRSRSKTRLLVSSLVVALTLGASQSASAQSGAKLTGVVLDLNGAVIVGTSVSLYSRHETLQTTSDSKGEFQFANLLPGTYRLEAKRIGFERMVIQPIHIKEEGPASPSITLKMEVAVYGDCGDSSSVSYEERESGTAQLAGAMQPVPPKPEPNVDWPWTPFSSATVEILRASSNQVVASVHPDDYGRFQFSGLEMGEYSLRVSYGGYHEVRSENFQINAEDVTKVTVHVFPLVRDPILCM
jgi:Carboxypeptidase regulatory-like domain